MSALIAASIIQSEFEQRTERASREYQLRHSVGKRVRPARGATRGPGLRFWSRPAVGRS